MGQNVSGWQPTTPGSSAPPRFLWDRASSSSGTTAPEYPQTQQEHRLSGAALQNHARADVTAASRMRGGGQTHHCRNGSGSSGRSWPPPAALGPGPCSPSRPGSRAPSGGDARWAPASCGGQDTWLMDAALTDGGTALSSGRGCGVDEGCSQGRASRPRPRPRRPSPRTVIHRQTSLIGQWVGRRVNQGGVVKVLL